jgi:hypothetical protein
MTNRLSGGAAKPRGLGAFLVSGLRDAERRLRASVDAGPVDDRAVARVAGRSAVVRAVDRGLAFGERVLQASMAGRMWTRMRTAWDSRPASSRLQAIGAALLVAVASHLALQLWQGAPAGWLWLVLPVLAAFSGLVLVAASVGAARSG